MSIDCIDCIVRPLLIPCAGLVLFALPAWIAIRSAKHRRKFGIAIGTVWLGCSILLTVFASYLFSGGYERILDNGFSPDGREYVLTQTSNGEPYEVCLYIRNATGDWIFYYVDHEVWPWFGGGHLEFSDGKARVMKGKELYKEITIDADGLSRHYPSSISVTELFEKETR